MAFAKNTEIEKKDVTFPTPSFYDTDNNSNSL